MTVQGGGYGALKAAVVRGGGGETAPLLRGHKSSCRPECDGS